MSFAHYVTAVADAIVSRSGVRLAGLIDFSGQQLQQAVSQGQRSSYDLQGLKKLYGLRYLREFAEAHCASLGVDPLEALQHHMAASKFLRQAFNDEEVEADTWLVPALTKVAHNLHLAALDAEAAGQDPGAAQGPLESCGGELLALFTAAKKARDDMGMKQAALAIAITLFRVYVALNNPQLSRTLIATIQSPAFQPFDKFPASLRVTYMFYLGRMAILDDKLVDAETHLTYALRNCLAGARANVRQILYFLVPVRMVSGVLPSQRLLQQFDLPIYSSIAEAMRTGSVRQLNEAMVQHQWTFIQMGTYLVLDKLRYAVYRRLFRRVHAIHAESCEPGKAHQLPLRLFHAALTWMQDDWCQDFTECECLVCNLISRGFIKGYISHNLGIIVLAKQDPYPDIKKLMLTP